MIKPWQQLAWQQFKQAVDTGRLPHGILLKGEPGLGKLAFAEEMARALLPPSSVSLRAHPNVCLVEPEKEGQAIKIDQIRLLTTFINETALQDGYRVAIIHPANRMNANAANALLKTLEEPSSGAIIILISDLSTALPATITSRCQAYTFSAQKEVDKKEDKVRRALCDALVSLNAKQSDIVSIASQLQENDMQSLLDFLLSWLTDLLRLYAGATKDDLTHQDYYDQLHLIYQQCNIIQVSTFIQWVMNARASYLSGLNLNVLLVLESLCFRWMECVA